MEGYFFIGAAILNNVISQLLIKKGSDLVTWEKSIKKNLMKFLNPYLIIGIMLTVSTPIFVIISYKYFSLTFVYSLTSLNYIFVVIGAKVFFNEQINVNNIFSVVLITIGLIIFNI